MAKIKTISVVSKSETKSYEFSPDEIENGIVEKTKLLLKKQ